MFDSEFFPTPQHVSDLMLFNLNLKNRVVLEPSAGSGSLIDAIKQYSPKEIIACEKNSDLSAICLEKSDRFITNDFFTLTKEEVSHIDFIIANPPFSNADKHILHMWEIAPEGCEIVSLCNWETVDNTYSRRRCELGRLIEDNGTKENIGDCFSNAERKTDINIGLIHLYKPKTGENEFDGYFDLEEEYQPQENGVMQHNEILELVNRYVGAVRYFDEVSEMQSRMNDLISPISVYENKIEFKASYANSNKINSTVNRETFKKELQKGAWKSIFQKFDMERFVTSKVMSDINKFVEQQTQIPFTVKNVYKMVEMIVGTHGNSMNKVIIEVFDWLTSHHHENRLSLEGWKTNSEYVVNKKFIAPYCGLSIGHYGQPEIKWSNGGNRMDDLSKALHYIIGSKYDKKNSIENFFGWLGESVDYEVIEGEYEKEDGFTYIDKSYTYEDRDYKKNTVKKTYKFKEESNYFYMLTNGYDSKIVRYKLFGKWYEWEFFKVRVYKKGTFHAEFKDEKVWEMFNREAAKAKGFQLASKFRSNYKQKSNEVEVYV